MHLLKLEKRMERKKNKRVTMGVFKHSLHHEFSFQGNFMEISIVLKYTLGVLRLKYVVMPRRGKLFIHATCVIRTVGPAANPIKNKRTTTVK